MVKVGDRVIWLFQGERVAATVTGFTRTRVVLAVPDKKGFLRRLAKPEHIVVGGETLDKKVAALGG